MKLMETLFIRTQTEKTTYLNMLHSDEGSYTDEEIKRQLSRFRATYQIIEEAGLEETYEQWVEDHNEQHLVW